MNRPPQHWTEKEETRLGFLALFSLTVFFTKLGLNGMATFDDCFYAEKAKEILQNHDWWILTYNHEPAFENPPFYPWMASLSYLVFGVGDYAAKFPSALLGFLCVFLLYFMARYLFNPRLAFYAAFILATTYPFFKYGRHAMVDIALTFLTLAALACFLMAIRKNPMFFIPWGLFVGLAILDKSVLGLSSAVIPLAWVVLTSQWKKLFNAYFLLGCLAAGGLGSSWYLLEYHKFGALFLNTHFGWLIFERGLKPGSQPWFAHLGFFKDLATYYWPWLPIAAWGVYTAFRARFWKDENLFFIVLWPAIIITGVSMTQVRVLWYFMPAFPALALLSAYGLDQAEEETGRNIGKAFIAVGLASVVLLNALPVPLDKDRERDVRVLAPYVKYYFEKGDAVIGIREEFYNLNNAMLFYSDHAVEPLYGDPTEAVKAFHEKRVVLCLAHCDDLPEIEKHSRSSILLSMRMT